MFMARSSLVLASKAAELPGPIDGVTPALDYPVGAASDAANARRLGFTGRLCIHPNQVDGVNAAFAPGPEEVGWARRIIEAAATGGAVRVDGHMVDAPVIQKARSVLVRAAANQ